MQWLRGKLKQARKVVDDLAGLMSLRAVDAGRCRDSIPQRSDKAMALNALLLRSRFAGSLLGGLLFVGRRGSNLGGRRCGSRLARRNFATATAATTAFAGRATAAGTAGIATAAAFATAAPSAMATTQQAAATRVAAAVEEAAKRTAAAMRAATGAATAITAAATATGEQGSLCCGGNCQRGHDQRNPKISHDF